MCPGILPEAVQRVVPPPVGRFITLIKDSSIVSLIPIRELTLLVIETSVSMAGSLEVWIMVAGLCLYLVLRHACALCRRNDGIPIGAAVEDVRMSAGAVIEFEGVKAPFMCSRTSIW